MNTKATRLDQVIMNRLKKDWAEPILWWSGEWWTGEDIACLAAQYRQSLGDAGFGKGHRLAVMMPNSPAVLAL